MLFILDVLQLPPPPHSNTIGFSDAFDVDFLTVNARVHRSLLHPLCRSFTSFQTLIKLRREEFIHGLQPGFPFDKYKTFATSGIYKLAFRPSKGQNVSQMALLRNDQWILCMADLQFRNDFIHFGSLACHLPANKTFLLCHVFQMFCYMLATTFPEVTLVKFDSTNATKSQLANLKKIPGSQFVNPCFVCGRETWE